MFHYLLPSKMHHLEFSKMFEFFKYELFRFLFQEDKRIFSNKKINKKFKIMYIYIYKKKI